MATSKSGSRRCALVLLAGLGWPCDQVAGQFGPLLDVEGAPQARTQEEFDQYLEVVAAGNARERLSEATEFLAAYPESALRGLATVYQMEAHNALDDFVGVLRTGEHVLQLVPENLRALLTLAAAIPNAVRDPVEDQDLLDRAESYATRALRVMDGKKIPSSIRLAEWKDFRAGMASDAHEALGHIEAKRGHLDRAIAEFHRAVELNPVPEGRQLYRLGATLAAVGRSSDASQALRRAVALGPELVRRRAEQELRRLEEPAPNDAGQ